VAFIELIGLGYTLPGKQLLFKDVDFKVGAGQRVALSAATAWAVDVAPHHRREDTEYSGTARVDGSFLYIGSSSPPGYDRSATCCASAATLRGGRSGADGG